MFLRDRLCDESTYQAVASGHGFCDDWWVSDSGSVIAAVAEAIREVSETIIEARFEMLARCDVEEKSPGELVTVVDREAEAALSARLRDCG